MGTGRHELFGERCQQIIDGALQVFSAKGFVQATNKDVAAAAGINSPGLIYHYFANKADLLRAVIERYAPPMQLLAQADALMALAPEEALPKFGQAYLDILDDTRIGACMRVLVAEAIRSPEFGEVFVRIGPMRVRQLLADYLQRKMDEGLLRQTSPLIAAHCFMGPLVSHMLARTILHLPDNPPIDTASLIAVNVRIFLQGLRTR